MRIPPRATCTPPLTVRHRAAPIRPPSQRSQQILTVCIDARAITTLPTPHLPPPACRSEARRHGGGHQARIPRPCAGHAPGQALHPGASRGEPPPPRTSPLTVTQNPSHPCPPSGLADIARLVIGMPFIIVTQETRVQNASDGVARRISQALAPTTPTVSPTPTHPLTPTHTHTHTHAHTRPLSHRTHPTHAPTGAPPPPPPPPPPAGGGAELQQAAGVVRGAGQPRPPPHLRRLRHGPTFIYLILRCFIYGE